MAKKKNTSLFWAIAGTALVTSLVTIGGARLASSLKEDPNSAKLDLIYSINLTDELMEDSINGSGSYNNQCFDIYHLENNDDLRTDKTERFTIKIEANKGSSTISNNPFADGREFTNYSLDHQNVITLEDIEESEILVFALYFEDKKGNVEIYKSIESWENSVTIPESFTDADYALNKIEVSAVVVDGEEITETNAN